MGKIKLQKKRGMKQEITQNISGRYETLKMSE